ncbi:MAG: type ISP restriction/modification enzyme [Nostoc sp.]|uniref:type ISP restriction/modification enzyme n=1 Tax=Nostoc sp. TaxID=1180 RepID=UPI002FF8D1D0
MNPLETYLQELRDIRSTGAAVKESPFDIRWIYWEPETKLLDEKRTTYFSQTFDTNLWILSQQKPRREWSKPQIICSLGCTDLMDRGASCIPLFLKPDPKKLDLFFNDERRLETGVNLNISDAALEYLKSIGSVADAEHLFYQVFSILHAPNYQIENDGALRQDWARIPLPENRETLIASAELGRRVAALLDPENSVTGVTSGKIRPELQPIATHILEGYGLKVIRFTNSQVLNQFDGVCEQIQGLIPPNPP